MALLLIPTLGFGLPALLGSPLIPGDDRFQNFPLRVLVGQLLRSGHLPFWNRWIWSGTPLLAGFNAGAFYPGTFLFAVLSPVAAWALNEIGVYAVGAVGFYLLLRENRLTPIAALAGAAAGTFCGMMALNVRHIGTVEGMCWLPWMLLALDRIADRDAWRWGWWALLCAGGGFVLLAGEPRATSNVAIAVVIYFAGLLRRAPSRRELLLFAVGAAPVSFAIGAAQLLPGLHFVATSQRGVVPFDYFAILSLEFQALPLQLLPALLGDFEHVSQYTQSQGSGYAGLLPLVALVSFPFWFRKARGRAGTWLAMVVIGFLLSLGENTPLGELLFHVPFYGSLRFQFLNMAITDVGLAGLLACWVDVLLKEGAERPRLGQRLLGLVPSLAVLALVACAIWWGPALQDLVVENVRKQLFAEVYPYLAMSAVLAMIVAVFAAGHDLIPQRARGWALLAVVGIDLSLWLAHQDLSAGTAETAVVFGPSPDESRRMADLLGPTGRFAFYDPHHRAHRSDLPLLLTPDLAGLYGFASVQGYGSIIDAKYWDQTGSHLTRHLDIPVLEGTLGDDLDLRLLVVPRSYLVQKPGSPLPAYPELGQALSAPHWQELDGYGELRLFANTRPHGHLWVVGADGVAVPDAQASVVRLGEADEETDHVSSSVPATVVRSVAYGEGWIARLRAADGTTRDRPAFRHGVLQGLTIPAGDWTIEWSYWPPGATLGITLSSSAVVGLIGLLAWLRLRRRVSPS